MLILEKEMIKFGTSGWRGIMGEEFTFQNVRIVVQAIANYLRRKFSDEKLVVVINYDTRFLSERYAHEAAKILSHNRIHVLFSDRDAPTQAESYQIIKRQAHGGINFTASFNPPEYNGLKYNTHQGAPALPEETDEIEKEVSGLVKGYSFCPYYPDEGYIEKIDFRRDYLNFIQKKIDFDLIRSSGIRIAVDLLYGTSREYLDEILEENKIPSEEIHGYIDPYFGGITPSCVDENLQELKNLVRQGKFDLGMATDADGDRFGIVDEKGRFVQQNFILALILEYLLEKKKWRGGVARSVATTHLIDRIARRYDLSIYKTPVGFKYIADLYLQKKIIFGGEESACLTIKDHLPEKDGIIAGLLVAEIVASAQKPLSELIENLHHKYGRRVFKQESRPLSLDTEKKLNQLINNPPPELAGRKVENVVRIDGIKLDFRDDDWVLLRLSGTEPLIRCYAEAGEEKDVNRLISAAWEQIL